MVKIWQARIWLRLRLFNWLFIHRLLSALWSFYWWWSSSSYTVGVVVVNVWARRKVRNDQCWMPPVVHFTDHCMCVASSLILPWTGQQLNFEHVYTVVKCSSSVNCLRAEEKKERNFLENTRSNWQIAICACGCMEGEYRRDNCSACVWLCRRSEREHLIDWRTGNECMSRERRRGRQALIICSSMWINLLNTLAIVEQNFNQSVSSPSFSFISLSSIEEKIIKRDG